MPGVAKLLHQALMQFIAMRRLPGQKTQQGVFGREIAGGFGCFHTFTSILTQ
jgi:hypothetical protein